MKFVCDNCKAKYQIGDDKVAGKTLRMKCRRCGHMIQVAATVTESSVSQKLPTEPAAGSVPAGSGGMGSGMGPLEGPSEDGATIVRPSPLFLFDHKTAAPIPPAPAPSVPGASGPGVPPRPGAGTGNIPRPAGVGAPIGGAPRIVPPARPSLRNSNPPPQAPMHSPSSPGLHSGFQAAVAAPVAQTSNAPGAAPLPTEDWYVGVGGVPLGPVRLSIVREKAANGQVDQDSLVWREGFDEWLPIKSFPALSALVDEVKQQRISRTSAPTPSPSAAMPSPLGFTPGPAPAVTSGSAPAAPQAAARNPFASQPATSGSLAAAARALAASAPATPSSAGGAPRLSTPSVPEAAPSIPFDLTRQSSPPPPAPLAPIAIKDPFAPPHANGAANGTANGAGHAVDVRPSLAPPEAASTGMGYGLTTTAAVSGSSAATAPRLDTVPPSELAERKKKGVHPMVWAFVAMAAAFGGVAAWALFLRKPDIVYVPKEGEVVATQPGGAAPPPPPTGAVPGSTSGPEVATSPTESAVAVAGPNKGGPLPPGTTAKPGETAAPLDTSGFGTGGPSGPGTAATSGGSKGALNESQLNGVVSSNSPRVRRKCWDPLVSGRSSNAPNSVKVTATVKVGPSGAVKSVSTSGGNDQYYPGLASCVQSTVSGWTFPASDEGGTVVVPFGFNAQ